MRWLFPKKLAVVILSQRLPNNDCSLELPCYEVSAVLRYSAVLVGRVYDVKRHTHIDATHQLGLGTPWRLQAFHVSKQSINLTSFPNPCYKLTFSQNRMPRGMLLTRTLASYPPTTCLACVLAHFVLYSLKSISLRRTKWGKWGTSCTHTFRMYCTHKYCIERGQRLHRQHPNPFVLRHKSIAPVAAQNRINSIQCRISLHLYRSTEYSIEELSWESPGNGLWSKSASLKPPVVAVCVWAWGSRKGGPSTGERSTPEGVWRIATFTTLNPRMAHQIKYTTVLWIIRHCILWSIPS